MSREQMALFAKHGVNPVGGCLPMLVQMPIFFALYSALAYEPSLYNAEFFYLKDLSAQDPYGLLPAFVVAGMFVQQRITPITGMDETQARILKFMPLVFGLMMWSAPAGLSLYYSLNTVLAIAQQWYNTRSLPPIVPVGAPDVAT
jgi:YidC/Oxa1 family membrane protein insertase